MLLEIELNKLRDEIYELKKCQVDFIKLSVIVFGGIASIIGVLLPYLRIFNGEIFNPWPVFIYIMIIGIIPLTFPYILWIIIHKSRSIFRIVAYIRAVEFKQLENKEYKKEHVGYETLHRKLREFPWLSVRISSFDNIFSKVKHNLMSYKKLTEKADSCLKEKYNSDSTIYISNDGLEEKNTGPYIGDYYGRIIFFIKLLINLGYLSLIPFIYIGIKFSANMCYRSAFIIIAFLIAIWSQYHSRISKRYLTEIRFRPFSMDAYYDMWMWAIKSSANNNHA